METKKVLLNTLGRLRKGGNIVESESLDIKGEWYSNTNKGNWKFEFAKDVCAMANSLSKRDSYLIFGLLERKPFIKNINISLDEASLQEIIKSKVTPIPKLKIDSLTVDDCSVYVFTISGRIGDLPYFASKSNNEECIYIRRGSSTGLCSKKELDQILDVKREAELNIQIESHAIKSVKDINYKIKRTKIENIDPLLNELYQYTFDNTFKVYSEVMYTLSDVERQLRFEDNSDLTKKIVDVATKACCLHSLVNPLNYKVAEEHIELINQGLNLGYRVGNRAIRHEKSDKELGAAVVLLHDILRFAVLNRITSIKSKALSKFHQLKEMALKNNYTEAVTWLNFNMEDAQNLEGNELPEFHSELLQKFYY